MQILTHRFSEQKEEYGRLYTVFRESAKAMMPEVPVTLIQTPLPILSPSLQQVTGQTEKKYSHHLFTAQAFFDTVDYLLEMKLKRDECVAVCDVDLMFIGSIESVWEKDFDIAYTIRVYRAPYNTGIWFYRNTESARRFVFDWKRSTKFIHDEYCKGRLSRTNKYSGIDQGGLASAIFTNKKEYGKKSQTKLMPLPCKVWNCTQSELSLVDKQTKVIHMKSLFRKALFQGEDKIPPHRLDPLKPYLDLWRQYEQGAENG